MYRISRNIQITRNYSKFWGSLIDVKPEVADALVSNGPVVALESTIISHGMAYPHNLKTAIDVENIVRKNNAIPATIGIINGRIKVGLEDDEFEILAKQPSTIPTVKTSRRDFGYVLSKGLHGGTTVAGTTLIANSVGIDVFATGGIGGVHRGSEHSMDISADLTELGRSFIAVVSSGVKSILDIPKTLEYLETQGVTVASYQSPDRHFPAFYTRKSKSKAPFNIDNPTEAAKIISAMKAMNLKSGILIAVPVPQEFAMDDEVIENVISIAIEKAKSAGISGKEATPFLLSAISEITDGKSLGTNIALIKNNAEVAAQIAVELTKRKSNGTCKTFNTELEKNFSNIVPVVIGGSVVDVCYTSEQMLKLDGATYHTSLKSSIGGVGRNIAEGLFKLHGNVQFISKLGADQNGEAVLNSLPKHCHKTIDIDPIEPTATCAVVFDSLGDAKLLLANMKIHQKITSDMIIKYEQFIAAAPVVVFDGNLPTESMGTILDICRKYEKPAFFEPTDMLIATKPFTLPPALVQQIKFISPNIHELDAIATHLNLPKIVNSTEASIDQIFENDQDLMLKLKSTILEIMKFIDNVIVTIGPRGILIGSKRSSSNMYIFNNRAMYVKPNITCNPYIRLYEVNRLKNIVNVSGAGDSFNVGFISAMLRGSEEEICISVGFESAKTALNSSSAVPNDYFHINHPCWTRPSVNKTI